MDSHELNLAVAKALGWEIVPKHKENSGTFVAGKTYLLGHRDASGRLRITHPECRSRDWSPATDTADALAALQAWCQKTLNPAVLRYHPGIYQWHANADPELPNYWGQSLPEAVCHALLAAAEAAHG